MVNANNEIDALPIIHWLHIEDKPIKTAWLGDGNTSQTIVDTLGEYLHD
jgi:hypothetical protein